MRDKLSRNICYIEQGRIEADASTDYPRPRCECRGDRDDGILLPL